MRFDENPYAGAGTPVGSMDFPDVLPMFDALEHLSGAREQDVFLGVDQQCQPVSVDVLADSPHVLVNAGTGGGKSAIVRAFIAQHAARGGMALVLDYKRISQRWCADLRPVVHRACALVDIGGALVSLGRELHRRLGVVDAFPGAVEDAPVGPPILVAFEELNATLDQLKELDRRLPRGTYTAMQAYREAMFLGRAVGIRVVATAQLASWKAIGGPEVGANFDTRILLRYDETAWRWLVGARVPFQASPTGAGRGMVCRASTARLTQFVWMTEDESTQYVLRSPRAHEVARLLSDGRVSLPEPREVTA